MTVQIPDLLHDRGRRFDLMRSPLRPYLDALPPERRPRFVAPATCLWRGYVATWRIRRGRLLLEEIAGWAPPRGVPGWTAFGRPADAQEVSLAAALPWLPRPAPATWVSGWLCCPMGPTPARLSRGLGSSQLDRWLLFDSGVLRREVVVEGLPNWASGFADKPRALQARGRLRLRRGM